VEIILTSVREDKRANPEAIRRAVNSATILLVASAPCYPHGVIDPIAEIAGIALEKNIPFHVDACMGGMLLPFVEKLGYQVPEYDFRVPGVTSISADLHKYGYSPKGASVILYHDRALRRHQFFACTEWPGGIYGSAAFSGSRSGGPVAAAWATLMNLVNEGYLKMAKNVMETSRKLQAGINGIEGLRVIGKPDMGIVAFTSDTLDIFEVGDALSDQKWFLDRIQFPNALHLTIAEQHTDQAENFLSALRLAVAQTGELKIGSASSRFLVSFVKGLSRMLPETWFRKLSHSASRLLGGEDDNKHTMGAAVYGITSGIENRGNVHEMVLDVLDNLY
jgi:glutamate/tyrosine decarboxylase-like PLP-dependent enzyme